MNKKTIIALTAITMSSLAIGALSFAKFNKNTFVKADAANKTITLDSSKAIELDGDSDMFLGNGNISTGTETYVYADIYGDYCDFTNGTSNFLSFDNGGWGAEVYIRLDVRGLLSYKVNGNFTNVKGTDYQTMNMLFTSYLLKSDGVTVDDEGVIETANDLELNTIYYTKDIDDTLFYSESILIQLNNFDTLNISSIELTMSCQTN